MKPRRRNDARAKVLRGDSGRADVATRSNVSAPAEPAGGIRSRRPWWRVAIGVLVLVSIACGAALGWSWYTLPERVRAALPERPAIAEWPESFGRRLDEAEQLARVRATALDGVADLGALYHANGFIPEAEACWRILVGEEPKQARWRYLLADAMRAASDYEAMESLWREVVERAPDYAPAWLHLGKHLFKTGRTREAEAAFRTRLRLVPDDPDALLGLARISLQDGQRAEARAQIEKTAREHPQFAAAHNLLAELLAADGDEAGATRHRQLARVGLAYSEPADPWLDELVAHCFDTERLRVLATIEHYAQRSERAVALMERAAGLKPHDPAGYAALGDLYVKLGDGDRARAALETSLRLSGAVKGAIMVHVNLSHAYRQLKQPERALEVVRSGLEAHPGAFELHDELGVVLGELGRLDEAVDAFARAVSHNPGDANANYNLALACLRLGRRAEAVEALERSLTLKPAFAPSLALLGRMALEEGRLAEAEPLLRALYAAAPERLDARHLLANWELAVGTAAEKSGDPGRAERHYRAGVLVDEDNVELQARLGALLLVEGRVDRAVVPLEAFRRLEPTNPQAALFLGQAYARLGRIAQARQLLEAGVLEAERAGHTPTAEHCREILRHLR